MIRKSPLVLAALSIIILLVVASTAGCTSSTTSSPSSSPQASGAGASVAPSGGQSGNTLGYPADSSGFDPDPSIIPRYTPSVRTISINFTNHGYTAFGYDTKDSLQQVSAFYQTQMAKLGYTSQVYSNTTTQFWVKYNKNGRTVIDMNINRLQGDALSKFPNENYTGFSWRLEGPNYDGS
jgi:archaellum component FlaF (FlaF/FlaG flagellin family)